MKSINKKKQESESSSKFELLVREIFESFIRKTDSDKRISLFGNDPFRE